MPLLQLGGCPQPALRLLILRLNQAVEQGDQQLASRQGGGLSQGGGAAGSLLPSCHSTYGIKNGIIIILLMALSY